MYVCMYVCVYVCMYVCMCVCVYVCMYVCDVMWRDVTWRDATRRDVTRRDATWCNVMYVCIYIYIYIHTHTRGIKNLESNTINIFRLHLSEKRKYSTTVMMLLPSISVSQYKGSIQTQRVVSDWFSATRCVGISDCKQHLTGQHKMIKQLKR